MDFNEKQIAILKVAEQLISEKGFEATTVREISSRADINLAMINYYFGSKEKLLEALFVWKANQFRIQTEMVVQDSNLGNLDKVLKLAENYFNRVFNNFCFHRIILKESSYLDSTVAFDQIEKMKNYNFGILDEVINEGIASGEFNKNAGTDAVISIVNGTVSNYALNEKYYRIRWKLDPTVTFEQQTKDKIKDQIFYALKAVLTYEEKNNN